MAPPPPPPPKPPMLRKGTDMGPSQDCVPVRPQQALHPSLLPKPAMLRKGTDMGPSQDNVPVRPQQALHPSLLHKPAMLRKGTDMGPSQDNIPVRPQQAPPPSLLPKPPMLRKGTAMGPSQDNVPLRPHQAPPPSPPPKPPMLRKGTAMGPNQDNVPVRPQQAPPPSLLPKPPMLRKGTAMGPSQDHVPMRPQQAPPPSLLPKPPMLRKGTAMGPSQDNVPVRPQQAPPPSLLPKPPMLRKGTAMGPSQDHVPVRPQQAPPPSLLPKPPMLRKGTAMGPSQDNVPVRPQQALHPSLPPKPAILRKGTDMGPSQDHVPVRRQQAIQPKGSQPPPAPPPPPLLGQPDAGALRKWAPVQPVQTEKKQLDLPHMGLKFPELVPPDATGRAKKKAFRFLQQPTQSPEEAPSSVCLVDQSQQPPVYSQSPPSAADEIPLISRLPLRQPKKLPKVAGSAGLTFAEELKLRSNMRQQQAAESQGYQSQQTLTAHECRPIPAPKRPAPYVQVPASESISTIHELPTGPEANLSHLEPPPGSQWMKRPPQSPGYSTPQQYLHELDMTSEPLLVVPKRLRPPRPSTLRVGRHKYATPDGQQPQAPGEVEYVNIPKQTAPQVSGSSQRPPRPQPHQYQTEQQQPVPQDQWMPQPGWPLPNVKPNSRGLIPPAPPLRDRTHVKEQKMSSSPLPQSLAVGGTLPRHPAWSYEPVEYGPPAITPRTPPHEPQRRVEASAGVPQAYDVFVGSQNVIALTEENFNKFIAQKELAMVMFYDPFNPNSLQPKEDFKKAADTMRPVNRQFAAVNCNMQPSFCASQGVSMTPTLKIYSMGKALSTIQDVSHFSEKEMRQYMLTLSDLRQPRKKDALRQPQKECTPKMPRAQHSKCSLAKRLGFKK